MLGCPASTPSSAPGSPSPPPGPRSSSACRAATTRPGLREALELSEQLRAVGARRVVAVDAAAYFSRPGPRLVDGVELLAHALHPDLVPEAVARALTVEL